MSKKLLIIKESYNYTPLDIIEDFQLNENKEIVLKEGILPKNSYILLEKLSNDDINQVKTLIKAQLRIMFWNLYTKQNYIVQ